MKPPAFVLGLAALLLAGCGGGRGAASPTVPTATLNLTGTWRGTVSDNSGTAEVTVRLTHSGNALTGSISMISADGRFTGEGSVAGTLSGTTITFTVTFPRGSYRSSLVAGMETCSATLSGSGTDVTNAVISGTYTGSNTCSYGDLTRTFVVPVPTIYTDGRVSLAKR